MVKMIAISLEVVWPGATLSASPARPFFVRRKLDEPLAGQLGLQQGCDAFQYPLHAQVGIHYGVDFVVMRASVHDQNFRSFVSLLHHVGQVMAIVLGQGRPEDDEVKSVAAQSVLNRVAVEDSGHVMAGLLHFGGLGGECRFVAFGIQNLDN